MPCPPGTAGWLGSQTTHTLYDMNCELFLKPPPRRTERVEIKEDMNAVRSKGDVMGGIPVMGVVSDSYL